MKINYEDYVGKTIGYLTILKVLKLGGGANFYVRCQCKTEYWKGSSEILRGKYLSCGCKRWGTPRPSLKGPKHQKCENLTGQKFGKLIVIRIDPDYKSNYVKWICKCECNRESSVRSGHLKQGNTTSCGECGRRGKNCYKWKGYEEISGKFFYRIQKCAINRGYSFDITIKQIWDIFIKQDKKCNLSGLLLKFPSIVGSTDGTASLDRIDNTKGYFLSNCQWVHKDINFIKQDFNEKELINYCRLITNYQKQKTQEINLESNVINYEI